MPCHSEIGQSKSLFLLTVALLCFQAKKLPFSHGNGHSDWLTEWLFLYNYRIIYHLANTKNLHFSTYWCTIILCNAANYPVSQVLDTQLIQESTFALKLPSMFVYFASWHVHCEFFRSRPFPGLLSVIWNN